MSNDLTKVAKVFYDDVLEGFDAECVLSKEVVTRYPDSTGLQRAGQQEWLSQEYAASVVTGLDLSAATPTDVIDRKVPITYRSPSNVVFELDALEMRDSSHLSNMAKAARKALNADIETAMGQTIAARAGVVVAKSGAFTWDMGAEAEAHLVARGTTSGMDRKLFLNVYDNLAVAKELGGRQYFNDAGKTAWEKAKIPNIANFTTFRSDQIVNSVAKTASTVLVNGANQKHTVAAMSGDALVDNRQMTLVTDGADAASVAVGDSFTITGVNAVHNQTKQDTGVAMTFRVLANTAGSLTITPAIIADGPYQNVSAAPADNATLTFINTTTKPINPFWSEDACVLSFADLAVPTGQGVQVMKARTAQGVPIVMMYSFDAKKAKSYFRFTTMYSTAVLQPEKCGFIVANQA